MMYKALLCLGREGYLRLTYSLKGLRSSCDAGTHIA